MEGVGGRRGPQRHGVDRHRCHLPKKEARAELRRGKALVGLPLAAAAWSSATSGRIVHVDGRVLGHHAGIIHYTIGQRRGLGVAAGEPLDVTALDAAGARVIVGPREALATSRVRLRDINWLGDGRLEDLDPAGSTLRCGCAQLASPRRPG